MTALPTKSSGPLTGVRILDMTSVICGAYATQMLGDLGADIIKVEFSAENSKNGGDIMRWAGTVPEGAPADLGPIYMTINRNKRSVLLDARNPDDAKTLRQIIKTCDAFAVSVRYDGLKRLGLDFDSVKEIKPDIVYVHCAGYGASGDYRGEPAYDDLIQSISGMADINNCAEDNEDLKYVPSVMADKVSGHFMTQAVLAALFHQCRTGEGQFVEVPMFECMTTFNLAEHLFGHVYDPPTGQWTYSRVANPFRNPFPTKDGHIGLLPYTDQQWITFFAAVGCGDTHGRDPRFSTYADRQQNIRELYALLRQITVTKTTQEWLDILKPHSMPVARTNRIEDLMDDPHLKSVGLFERYVHPEAGAYFSMRPPVNYSKTPANIYRHPPRLGEHTDEVLKELSENSQGSR